MKGVTKWKLLTKFVIALAILFIGSAVSLKNTNAVSTINSGFYYRSFSRYRSTSPSSQTFTRNESMGTHAIPYPFLGYESGYYRNLYGLSVTDLSLSGGDSSKSYNTLKNVKIVFSQANDNSLGSSFASSAPFVLRIYGPNNAYYGSVNCSTTLSENSYTYFATVICPSFRTSDYQAITAMDFTWGSMSSSDGFVLAVTSPSNPMSVLLYSVEYDIETSSDPSLGELSEINQGISDISSQLEQQNQQDQQDRQDLQDTSDDAEASADSSGEQAESTGSTLLQAFTSFVSALTSASASDCTINFNVMGYINGGNVDLCRLNLPPAFQAISSLVLIGFCVPLSIATARKMINLFRSFQG